MLLFDVVKWQNKKLLMHLSANIILINIITVLVIVLYLRVSKTVTTIRLFQSTVLRK